LENVLTTAPTSPAGVMALLAIPAGLYNIDYAQTVDSAIFVDICLTVQDAVGNLLPICVAGEAG
jgi:hypothetical protein